MTWWVVKNNLNDKTMRVPAEGGKAEVYDFGWNQVGIEFSLEQMLELFNYSELQVWLES